MKKINKNKKFKILILFIILAAIILPTSFALYRETKISKFILNITRPKYTISFNANGGSGGQTSDVEARYKKNLPEISTTAPTKNGKLFGGWYDSIEGGNKYYNEDGVGIRKYELREDVTLYARWLEPPCVIYDANGGVFDNEGPTHIVEYNELSEAPTQMITKYSHTANIDDSGVATSTYSSDQSTTDVVTIPGATSINIEVWYSTENSSDWLAIYPENITPNSYNYTDSISSGKLTGHGTYENYEKPSDNDEIYHKIYTIDGDTAKFYFRSNYRTGYYGYYAIITGEGVVNTEDYETPTRVGYKKFENKWCDNKNCTGEIYDNEQEVIDYLNSTGDTVKVYAKWIPKTFTIRLMNPDINISNQPTEYITLTYDSNVIEPSEIIIPEREYDTVFDIEPTEARNTIGATITGNTEPIRTSYEFDGWAALYSMYITCSQQTCEYTINGGDKAMDNSTRPSLIPNTTGEVDENGNWTSDTAGLYSLWKEKENTTINLPTIEKEGYQCGWTTKNNKTDIEFANNEEITPLQSTTYYPVCNPIKYKIKYQKNGDGVSGYIEDQQFTYNISQNLLENNYEREGYQFTGWAISEDGEAIYQDQEEVNNLTTTDNDEINLYAKWKPLYTVIYNSNTGIFNTEIFTKKEENKVYYEISGNVVNEYSDGVRYKEYTTPEKPGYIFDGWSTLPLATAASYKTEAEVKNIIGNTNTITLYAIWKRVWAENISHSQSINDVECTTVQCTLDELAKNFQNKGTTQFQLGDYVKMTPTNNSYTVNTDYTGTTTAEVINPQELNIWRIIRINEDGTYDAVSDKTSSTKITFAGIDGYKNYVGYLNKLASQYENNKYTVGSRNIGYNGQTEYIKDTYAFDGSTFEKICESQDIENKEEIGCGDELYKTDMELVQQIYGNERTSADAYAVGSEVQTSYWVSSKYYSTGIFCLRSEGGHNSQPNVWGMFAPIMQNPDYNVHITYLRFVHTDPFPVQGKMVTYWGDVANATHALRPIITLRSEITATGEGTEENPYILN